MGKPFFARFQFTTFLTGLSLLLWVQNPGGKLWDGKQWWKKLRQNAEHIRYYECDSQGGWNPRIIWDQKLIFHDDVMAWKCFPHFWLVVRGKHWWLLDSIQQISNASRFPSQRASNPEHWCFLTLLAWTSWLKHIEVADDWDAVTLIWGHFNVGYRCGWTYLLPCQNVSNYSIYFIGLIQIQFDIWQSHIHIF